MFISFSELEIVRILEKVEEDLYLPQCTMLIIIVYLILHRINKYLRSSSPQTLFEQVWAADDYEIFKRMMIQKNLELQLQALELLQQRYGIIPESCMPGDAMSPEEQAVMEEVIK